MAAQILFVDEPHSIYQPLTLIFKYHKHQKQQLHNKLFTKYFIVC